MLVHLQHSIGNPGISKEPQQQSGDPKNKKMFR